MKLLVAINSDTEVIHEDSIPTNFVIVPNSRGWHVIRGEDYLFVSYSRLHEIYEGALYEIWTKLIRKEIL